MITSNSEHLFSAFATHKDLVMKFFVFFSRFEYALKKSGYVRENRGKVEVDWDKYTNEIGSISESKTVIDAKRYFLDNPPKKQVLFNEQLDWKDNQKSNSESDVKYLLRLIKTVRNNLFHGGKMPFDAVRDKKLLENALILLEVFLKTSPDITKKYFSGEME